MMKKDMCLQRKMYAAGMRPRIGRTATASEKGPGHDPIALPKWTESGQNGGPFGVMRWSWPYKWDAVEETDYRQTPTSPDARRLS